MLLFSLHGKHWHHMAALIIFEICCGQDHSPACIADATIQRLKATNWQEWKNFSIHIAKGVAGCYCWCQVQQRRFVVIVTWNSLSEVGGVTLCEAWKCCQRVCWKQSFAESFKSWPDDGFVMLELVWGNSPACSTVGGPGLNVSYGEIVRVDQEYYP